MRGGGEIVQVDGGLILRSTGRKDRHSKVYTSKGPRDRRVRLSAHTAIQFYDVQDRLGYDRPSKAVDWLIKKAKSAIDNLSNPSSNPQFIADSANPSHFVSFFPGDDLSRASFQEDHHHLGLSLQTFQGNVDTFQGSSQRTDNGCWNHVGPHRQVFSDHGTASFPNRELLHSNLPVLNNPWTCCSRPSDFGTPFDLGFPVYGEEDQADNHGG